MADQLWLRADYPIGPFSQQPVEQAICDVLAKAPYSAWTTGDCAFRWDYVDRPAAGTACLILLQPPNRPIPPDGLRYLFPEAPERRTVSQHSVTAPESVANPTSATRFDVVLECFTSACGHLPPMAPSQPLPSGSPEFRLTRFRKRWRLMNGSQPALWFVWWGQDESGGLGQGQVAPTAPQGWESTPARQYPLAAVAKLPSPPFYPFPNPNRQNPSAGTANPSSDPAARANGSPYGSQPVGLMPPPATPLARQQQLAALASQAGTGFQGSNLSALEIRQQQYQALAAQQQQQQQAAMAAAANNANQTGQMLPPGLTPHQISAMQARQIQQQQQQAAYQAAAAAAAQATGSAARGGTGAGATSSRRKSTSATTAPGTTGTTATPAPDEPPRSGDILDQISPRQLEMHRYALQHQLLAPIFDAWPTTSILAGEPRVRQLQEVMATGGASTRTGEGRNGVVVPGLAADGPLAQLAVSAARIPVAVAKGEELSRVHQPVEERRAKLEEMLRDIQEKTVKQEEWYRAQAAAFSAQAAAFSATSTPRATKPHTPVVTMTD